MGLLLGSGNTKPQYPYDYYYGVEWDVTVSNPKLKRIGKMELHASLPVQSQMRRCILRDNGTVAYYLHPNDSTKMDNGSPAKLDGTDGQVMVELPTCFVKFEADGNKRRCLMSTYELPGFHKWERCFVSAYQATVQRSADKLASVMNTTTDYRGGNNNASLDNLFNSQLGLPASFLTMTKFRQAARNRGSINWNTYTYEIHKRLFWMYVVEYANFNSQENFSAAVDDNGYRQGGLGKGTTRVDAWAKFAYHPVVPCGTTNSLGNKSGYTEYSLRITEDGSQDPELLQVCSYRGVENFFGNELMFADGAKCILQPKDKGGDFGFYVCRDVAHYGTAGTDNYDYRGDAVKIEGYIKDIIFGEYGDIIPTKVGGGSSVYYCDYVISNQSPQSVPQAKVIIFSGFMHSGPTSGMLASLLNGVEGGANAYIGTRLTFIPN